jgi:hypothetical protein
MPFTFAHPAAVLPLRRFGDLTALVIGSMIPDAGYLLMVGVPRELSHTPLGLLLFCLPLGLLAYVLYLRVLYEPWAALTPECVARRVPPPRALPNAMRAWLGVAAALVAGAATHLVWDLFSFSHGIPAWMPVQSGTIISLAGREFSWYELARHGSSVFGLVVIALWIGWAGVSTPARSGPVRALEMKRFLILLALVGAGLAAASILLALWDGGPYGHYAFRGRVARIAVGLLSLGAIGYAVAWQLLRRLRPASSAGR